jgi:hypothetical protein
LDKTIKDNNNINHSKANYNKAYYYKQKNQKFTNNKLFHHLGLLAGKNQEKKKKN